MQVSPRLLLRRSSTLSPTIWPMFYSEAAEKQLELSCNLVICLRFVVMIRIPTSPILFSPNSNDFIFWNEASCAISSSLTSSLGRSTSWVSSVTVIFLIVASETGRVTLVCVEVKVGVLLSNSISNLRDISWIAASNLLFASESSLELSSREASICACLANSCLHSSFYFR